VLDRGVGKDLWSSGSIEKEGVIPGVITMDGADNKYKFMSMQVKFSDVIPTP